MSKIIEMHVLIFRSSFRPFFRLYIEGIPCNKRVLFLIEVITDPLTLVKLFLDQIWTKLGVLYKVFEFLLTTVKIFSNT